MNGKDFKGHRLPFGSEVTYVPPQVEDGDKILPRGRPAIFLGYSFAPDGSFHDEYRVLDMEYFLDVNRELKVVRTRDMRVNAAGGVHKFPIIVLKEAANAIRHKNAEDKARQRQLAVKVLGEEGYDEVDGAEEELCSDEEVTDEPQPTEEETAAKEVQEIQEALDEEVEKDKVTTDEDDVIEAISSSTGRPTRRYKDSARPPNVSVDVWMMCGPGERLKFAREYAESVGAPMPKATVDYWEESDDKWTRVHVKARKAFFVPQGTIGEPAEGAIERSRVTHAKYENGTDQELSLIHI